MTTKTLVNARQTAKINAGVIGWPIKHSRSPLIHGHWLREHQIDGSYEKIAVEPTDLESFINNLKTNNLSGLNVTVPHKEMVFKFADLVTEDAKSIGAANTLWFENDKLIAGNTDGYGFITHLKLSASTWETNKPVMVLGAGGAARAILYALLNEGVPEINLTNRTRERAENLAKEFGPKIKVVEWEDKENHLQNCGLLVNSTSLGMTGSAPLEINISPLPKNAICYDIVYAPLETQLLKDAKNLSLGTVDGLGMLLHQAVPGFEKWFGIRPEVTEELRQIILNDLA
ncbi:MAG: shikimate dehydrogenase [Rhizobiales bacterium]|nr:shikimate dehydrogenase [Hyphomicrobiales bacterium]